MQVALRFERAAVDGQVCAQTLTASHVTVPTAPDAFSLCVQRPSHDSVLTVAPTATHAARCVLHRRCCG